MFQLQDLSDDDLAEHLRLLINGCLEACAAYEKAKSAALHAEFLATHQELKRRRGDDYPKTGLEGSSPTELVDIFVERAIAYDEAVDMQEVEERYWELDAVSTELQRREGDQRRILFKLYFHPDERVHFSAAQETRILAPVLAVDRMQSVGDEGWSPPADGPGAYEAQLHGFTEKPSGKRRTKLLDSRGVEELAELFVYLSIELEEAERVDEIARYNRLYYRKEAVSDELKRRDGDQRRILARFYNHPNFKVRVNVAHATLAIMPDKARRVFEIIAQSDRQNYSSDARSTLESLDNGFYKPK